ncbi:epidermal growth factor receptor kinase substrate 8-like protein 3 [Phascolarctos cinereus]
MSRPSSKTIYEQRKEYSQTMAAEPTNLKLRVEHLLTCKLGSGTIQEPKDVIEKLQMMDAQGQVWGQDVVLQVKNHWLQILDIETREEMDSYPLDGIQSLDAILNSCSYNSVLLINLQEPGHPLTSVLLFQCWEVGAEILRSNLQKAIDESKKRQESRTPRLIPAYYPGITGEELNNILSEIELFVEMAKKTPKNNTKKKKILGKKKTPKGPLSEPQYIEGFQKIKRAFNFLGKLNIYLQQPDAPEFVHILFQALDMVMSNCPNPHWAASVDVPGLTSKVIDLLNSCLTRNEMDFWKSLGEFWTTSTDYGPDQEPTNSTYVPRFHRQSESSEFSAVIHQHNPTKNSFPLYHGPPLGGLRTLLDFIPYRASLTQQPLLMQVQYEFESRNPRELTVTQGEVLEILDHSRQWWLVKNKGGQRGYIPNNILEPVNSDLQRNRSWSSSPTRGPMLRPTSKPQEVRDWLESENFSNITIKSLGMLTGSQLLHMRPRELQLVCPDEAPRVLERIEEVKMMLGMGP